jgi:hypothetical protein
MVADAAQALQASAGTERAAPHIDALEHAFSRSRAHCMRDGLLPG